MPYKISPVSGHLYRDPVSLPQDKESWIKLIQEDKTASQEDKDSAIKRLNDPDYWQWFQTML